MKYLSALLMLILIAGMHEGAGTVTAPAARCETQPQASSLFEVIPEPVQVVGVASWYDATKNHAWYTRTTKLGEPVVFYGAAGPKLREALGDDNPYHEHYPVTITNPRTGITIQVIVVDWCSCSEGRKGEKIIDLAPAAFKALGVNLHRGIQKVIITLPFPQE